MMSVRIASPAHVEPECCRPSIPSIPGFLTFTAVPYIAYYYRPTNFIIQFISSQSITEHLKYVLLRKIRPVNPPHRLRISLDTTGTGSWLVCLLSFVKFGSHCRHSTYLGGHHHIWPNKPTGLADSHISYVYRIALR